MIVLLTIFSFSLCLDSRLSANVIPLHYDLYLRPNVSNKTFVGRLSLTSEIKGESSDYTLHADPTLNITSVIGVNTYEHVDERLIMHGENFQTISMEFSGSLDWPTFGWFYINDKLAVTQFEFFNARLVFPCFDDPSVKSTFSLSIETETNLLALSNMPAENITNTPTGKLYNFQKSHPMPTYLLAFVVGDLISLEGFSARGTPVRVYAEPGKENYLNFSLVETVASLDFFEDYFQVNYTLPVLQSVAVENFVYEGMENYGLIIYQDSSFLAMANNSWEYKMYAVFVIYHEVAHQWCGNLVSPIWWNNFWLNEGFATYLCYLSMDNVHPEWDLFSTWQTGIRAKALNSDTSQYTHPVLLPDDTPESAMVGVVDGIFYEKGGCILQALATEIGADLLKQVLRTWCTRFANKSAGTGDFLGVLNEVTEVNMTVWLNSWLEQLNYPVVEVEGRTLTQGVFPNMPTADGRLWNIPITMTGRDEVIRLNTKTISLDNVSAPDWFVLNNAGQAPYRTLYDSASFAQILTHLDAIPHTARAILLDDYQAFARAGMTEWTVVVDLIEALSSSSSSFSDDGQVCGRTVVAAFEGLMSVTDDAENLVEYGVRLLTRIRNNLGERTAGEPAYRTVLRSWAEHDLAVYLGDATYYNAAVSAFAAFRASGGIVPGTLDPSQISAMLRCGLLDGGADAFDFVRALISPGTDPELHKYAALSLGCVPEDTEANVARIWAAYEQEWGMDKFLIWMGLTASPTLGPETLWKYFTTHFEAIKEEMGKMDQAVGVIIDAMLSTLSTQAQADMAEAFFKANPMPVVNNNVARGLEQIRARAETKRRASYSVGRRMREILDRGDNTTTGGDNTTTPAAQTNNTVPIVALSVVLGVVVVAAVAVIVVLAVLLVRSGGKKGGGGSKGVDSEGGGQTLFEGNNA